MEVWPGGPYPLGATFDGAGTNFALFSAVADSVELCLFDADGRDSDPSRSGTRSCGTRTFRGSAPGQRYGYRVTARTTRARPPLQPEQAAPRPVRQGDRGRDRLGAGAASPTTRRPGRRNAEDSRRTRMKSVVVNPFFDWQDDRPPAPVPRDRHLRGTRQGPDRDATRTSPRRSAAPTPPSRTR